MPNCKVCGTLRTEERTSLENPRAEERSLLPYPPLHEQLTPVLRHLFSTPSLQSMLHLPAPAFILLPS